MFTTLRSSNLFTQAIMSLVKMAMQLTPCSLDIAPTVWSGTFRAQLHTSLYGACMKLFSPSSTTGSHHNNTKQSFIQI